MNLNQKNQPADLEISHLLGRIGVKTNLLGLMVFDSDIFLLENIPQRPFRSSHYSIIFVKSGSMCIKVNLITYDLQENGLLIIPPSAIREFDIQETPVHFLSLLFTPELLFPFRFYTNSLAQFSIIKSETQASITVDKEESEIISRLIELTKLLLDNSGINQQPGDVLQQVFQATILQVSQYYQEHQPQVPIANSIVQRFFELLVKHYKEEREVAFYADKLNIHEKYLSQVLKEYTGHTTRAYIIQMVILEAKVLLDYPDLTVSNVAEQLNFQNQFHFSRFFKKYTSVTPTEYRNNRL